MVVEEKEEDEEEEEEEVVVVVVVVVEEEEEEEEEEEGKGDSKARSSIVHGLTFMEGEFFSWFSSGTHCLRVVA